MCSRSASGSAEMRSSSAVAASLSPIPYSAASSIRRRFEPPPESAAAAILSCCPRQFHQQAAGSFSSCAAGIFGGRKNWAGFTPF
jgi:hypothetical protein